MVGMTGGPGGWWKSDLAGRSQPSDVACARGADARDADPRDGCRGHRGWLGREHGELAAGCTRVARRWDRPVYDPGAVLRIRGRVPGVPDGLCRGRALHAPAAARP